MSEGKTLLSQKEIFSPEEIKKIRDAIREKFKGVSLSAAGYFKYPVGREGLEILGYDTQFIKQMPAELLASFCGVGNPFSIAPVARGNTLLDIGCGTGVDLFIASRMVGNQGRVFGVDLTQEMLDKAEINLATLEVKNAELQLVSSEELPFTDNFFDCVLSNGVINLSPDKELLFSEVHRVLKPGGQLQFADIILEKELPQHLAASAESWSQ